MWYQLRRASMEDDFKVRAIVEITVNGNPNTNTVNVEIVLSDNEIITAGPMDRIQVAAMFSQAAMNCLMPTPARKEPQ